jgi:hypothetical protein
MKVRYTIPVRGVLQVAFQAPVVLDSWAFSFHVNDKRLVDRLIIELSDIPEEKWPFLIEVQQDPQAKIPRFPFDSNPKAVKFSDIRSQLVNFEGLLGFYGLYAFEFSEIAEEWIPESEEENEKSMFSGWSSSRPPCQSVSEPLTEADVCRLIVAANTDEESLLAFSHFRIGQEHLINGRYIEAIRHLFFVLEYEFGERKQTKAGLLENFVASRLLTKAIAETLINAEHKPFLALLKKYPSRKAEMESIINFFIDLRGQVQHTNNGKFKWHPRDEEKFQNEAICLMNVVEFVLEETLGNIYQRPK